MRSFVASPALVGEDVIPGAALTSETDILLAAFRRLSSIGPHAVGTCRTGSDKRAVVDPSLKVNGVDGLRVADCLIMPGPVTGNTNAPAMAVGYRLAGLSLDDRR